MRNLTTCEHHDCLVVHDESERCPLCISSEQIVELEGELKTEKEERLTAEKKLTEAEKRIEQLEEELVEAE